MPSVLGYGLGLSDTDVVFADGSKLGRVRKLHDVGRFMAAGFSGSVAIGFKMVELLRDLLAEPNENLAWVPGRVAQWWPRDAQELFESFPEQERQVGVHIVLVGVHPTDDSRPGIPLSDVYAFSSPDFESVRASASQALAVGSRVDSKPYTDTLEKLGQTSQRALKHAFQHESHVRQQLNIAIAVKLSIDSLIQQLSTELVAKHLEVCLVRRGNAVLGARDYVQNPYVDSGYQLVDSYAKFVDEARAMGTNAAGATG